MNSTRSHWKLQENISHSGFSQLECDGLRQEPKELNHIFNPDEHSALGHGAMLDSWHSTSRSPPKHIEDNGYILINARALNYSLNFLRLVHTLTAQWKGKTWTFISPAQLYKREFYSEKGISDIVSTSPSLVWHLWFTPLVHKSHTNMQVVEWRETTLESRTKYCCWWYANYFKSEV